MKRLSIVLAIIFVLWLVILAAQPKRIAFVIRADATMKQINYFEKELEKLAKKYGLEVERIELDKK